MYDCQVYLVSDFVGYEWLKDEQILVYNLGINVLS